MTVRQRSSCAASSWWYATCGLLQDSSVAATSHGKCGRGIAHLRKTSAKYEYWDQFVAQFSPHRAARQLLLCGVPTHLFETTHFSILLQLRVSQGFISDVVEDSSFSSPPLWRRVESATWRLPREFLFSAQTRLFFVMRFRKLSSTKTIDLTSFFDPSLAEANLAVLYTILFFLRKKNDFESHRVIYNSIF